MIEADCIPAAIGPQLPLHSLRDGREGGACESLAGYLNACRFNGVARVGTGDK